MSGTKNNPKLSHDQWLEVQREHIKMVLKLKEENSELKRENEILKERNEILRNYVTSLEETNERAQGEIWDLKELLAERRDLAELCKMIGRYKDNSEDEIEGTNIDNRKPNEELNEKKI